ncbi:MAG: glycosyltransferase family 4 protein [Clostridia bacterium]|nr:glycosyltransferase family 4 protein [Clostridia bacterium]
MRILYVTTVGGMMNFFKSFIYRLIKEGHTVDIACNHTDAVPKLYRELGCRIYSISCTRNPVCTGTVKAVYDIKRIVKHQGYDIVHCHSPIASMCTRIACMGERKKGLKVVYTAHGFHFYNGAPLKNWLIYYPIEKILSRFTDVLITINKEDYYRAAEKMNAKRTLYVPGVGIDTKRFATVKVNKAKKKREIGVPVRAPLLLSIGELNENKNHKTVIYALARMENKNIHYAVAGTGELRDELISLARSIGVEDRVHLLGFRTDIAELCKVSDYYIHPSFREGLPVSIMEAMATGLPVLVSDTRGCTELAKGEGALLFDPYNITECQSSISKITKMDKEKMGDYNMKRIIPYSVENINSQMIDIYRGNYDGKYGYKA